MVQSIHPGINRMVCYLIRCKSYENTPPLYVQEVGGARSVGVCLERLSIRFLSPLRASSPPSHLNTSTRQRISQK